MVLDLLGEGVCQPRKPPHRHAHGEVLPFNVGRADVPGVRVASLYLRLDPDALAGAVARLRCRR